jgi:hypothetical protein
MSDETLSYTFIKPRVRAIPRIYWRRRLWLHCWWIHFWWREERREIVITGKQNKVWKTKAQFFFMKIRFFFRQMEKYIK